jgi:hypothetical protein
MEQNNHNNVNKDIRNYDRYDSEKTVSIKEKNKYTNNSRVDSSSNTRDKYYSNIKNNYPKEKINKYERSYNRDSKDKFYKDKLSRSRTNSIDKYNYKIKDNNSNECIKRKDRDEEKISQSKHNFKKSSSNKSSEYKKTSKYKSDYKSRQENKHTKYLKIKNLPTEISESDVLELMNWGFIAYMVTESEGKPILNVYKSDDRLSYILEMRSDNELENALKSKHMKVFDREIVIEKDYYFTPKQNKGKNILL